MKKNLQQTRSHALRGNAVGTLRVPNPPVARDAKRPKGIPTQSMGTRKNSFCDPG
ncbi:hypothetical protein [Desulfonema magnum]|uniref:hypothetical protein n=1 Tax=Desulfonema magnum TaxID=45655 RepID=UPI001A9C0C31|nr:hypothetical protein [Desulfonema magnum]